MPGIADALTGLAGGDAIAALGQAASDAAFDRTVDMVTVMATDPDLRDQDARPHRAADRRPTPACSSPTRSGTVLSYMALCQPPAVAGAHAS